MSVLTTTTYWDSAGECTSGIVSLRRLRRFTLVFKHAACPSVDRWCYRHPYVTCEMQHSVGPCCMCWAFSKVSRDSSGATVIHETIFPLNNDWQVGSQPCLKVRAIQIGSRVDKKGHAIIWKKRIMVCESVGHCSHGPPMSRALRWEYRCLASNSRQGEDIGACIVEEGMYESDQSFASRLIDRRHLRAMLA